MSNPVVRVRYVGKDGAVWNARTLERPRLGEPTKLLVKVGARLELVHAHYSEQRAPETWHHLEPAS